MQFISFFLKHKSSFVSFSLFFVLVVLPHDIDFCLQDSVIGSVVVLPDTFTKVAGISSVELNDGAPAAVTIDLDKKSGDTMGVFLRQGDGFDQVGTRRSVSPSVRQYIRMARCCNKTTSLDLFLYRVYIICASPTLSPCSDFSCFLFCFFWGCFLLTSNAKL